MITRELLESNVPYVLTDEEAEIIINSQDEFEINNWYEHGEEWKKVHLKYLKEEGVKFKFHLAGANLRSMGIYIVIVICGDSYLLKCDINLIISDKGTTTHELKIFPRYFKAVQDGSKTFELRKNDRDFKVGDILVLKEFKSRLLDNTGPTEVVIEEGGYTGREISKRISYILEGGQFGLRKGYSILALGEVNKNE